MNTVYDQYRPGISTNWDFAGCLVGEKSEGREKKREREKEKKKEKTRGKRRSRAWVPTWYDAIMRHRGQGEYAGRKKRNKKTTTKEKEERSEKKEETRKRRGTRRVGPAALTLTRPEVEVG